MKKATLLKRLRTNRAIAEILGISVQAVTKWPDDKPIPPARLLQLKDKRPDLFGGAK